MRVIPVIDLKGGTAVHAVRGERDRYQPLRSVLVQGAEPLAVARAIRDRLGLDELYLADLDAIERGSAPHPAVAAIAREMSVMLDAGVGDAQRAQAMLDPGLGAAVIGTETLTSAGALGEICAALGGRRVILSLDLRDGLVASRAPQLQGKAPAAALQQLRAALLAESSEPVREVIVLELSRVGSGAGPDLALIAELHRRFPELELLAGGGVRSVGDLRALQAHGAAGALVATALHSGVIDRAALLSAMPAG